MTQPPLPPGQPEPEGGPFARDNYFMLQRLAGDEAIQNLAEHRRGQLQEYRKKLGFHLNAQLQTESQQAPEAFSAADSSQATGIPRDLNWTPLGSAGALNGQAETNPVVSGRVEAIASSADGLRVYVGSANGGIWRSDDGGMNWVPLMNAFNLQPNTLQADSLSVGALVINPTNKDRVYVGTGEGGSAQFNPANPNASASGSGYFGVGPAISDDGGLTWMTETLENKPADKGVAFYPMAVDPVSPQRVVAPTSNGLYVRESRNLAKFPANGFQPQSYLYRYKPTTGETFFGYWNIGIDDLKKAEFFGSNNDLKDFDQLIPFQIQGVPYYLFYKNSTGKYLCSLVKGDATRDQVSMGNFATGLSLMPFQLNGLPTMARYDKATGKASVITWNANGTFNTLQADLTWPKGWILQPIVVEGFPYFIGYNPTDGSLALRQWLANGMTTEIWSFGADTWPKGAILSGFELNDRQYIIRYIPADGSYIVDRVQDNLFLVSVTCANTQNSQTWAKNLTLTSFYFNDKPYLLTYGPASGVAKLYSWTDVATPVKKWSKTWDKNLILMPFQMGFEWLNIKAPDSDLNAAATSVVVASKANNNTFFAAFYNGPVYKSTDNGHTWVKIGGAQAFSRRISLAVQPSNPDLLYAIDYAANVYRLDTTDPTNVWKIIAGTPAENVFLRGQGNYDLVIAVLPSDPDIFLIGGATVNSGTDYSGAIYRGKVKDDAGNLSIDSATGQMTYIGASTHADIHAFTFPGAGNDMWVGTDGGAFFTTDVMNVNTATIFEARNSGLNTMTLEGIGQHPNYDAVIFAGSQDNGCQKYLGNAAWTVVSGGDCGAVVVNNGDTTKVINTYVQSTLYYSSSSGNKDTFNTNRSVPGVAGNQVLFYAPLAGPPKSSGQPNYLIFGANRPFISKDFGSNWQSLPTGTNDGDKLNGLIRSLSFAATSTIFYVGTMTGRVYKYTKKTGFFTWTRTQIDNHGTPTGLPSAAPITGIAVVPGDNTSVYVCFGGQIAVNGWKRVWKYDGGTNTWTAKSGVADGDPQSLLNLQYNAITFGASAQELFVAGDLGVWQSTDGGDHWQPMGNGLPEAAVLNLGYYPEGTTASAQPALLRASTYGRGLYEFILSRKTQYRKEVQLYVRDTVLDRGLYPTVDALASPEDPTKKVSHRDSPDIKTIQTGVGDVFPNNAEISFIALANEVKDKSSSLTKQKSTRFYVQVQQRGVVEAVNTSVRILLSTQFSSSQSTAQPTPTNPDPSPKPPVLPDNLTVLLEKGQPVPAPTDGKGWFDLGTQNIPALVAGLPKVVSVDIDATKLPTKGTYCLLAITYQRKDPFDNLETNPDILAVDDCQVAMKYLYAS